MDYYKVLDVNNSSSAEEIKKAYRKLSMKHHPDRGGNPEEFKKINEAYQILGDQDKRKQYEMRNNSPFINHHNINQNMDPILKMFFGGGGMPGFGGGMHGFGGGMPNVHIFRNGRPMNTHSIQKPPPIIKKITINLSQAYSGLTYPILIERWIIINNEKKIEKEKLYVNIHQGIDSGEIIIVKDKGNIINNSMKGDIKIHIRVENNSVFKRNGLNLKLKKTITLKESLTGFKFDIKHLNDKKYTITNDAGYIIPVHYKKHIDNLGIKRGSQIGKLIIEFEIIFPKKLTKEQINSIKNIL
jgi:DnaJ-class molecular chaperone